jgi:rhodanese-related sulfurtransferase
MPGRFGGDVSAQQAWQKLLENPAAVLVDVRTQAEWDDVGGPDLSSLGRPVVHVDWQGLSPAERAVKFASEVSAHGVGPEQPVFLICRSGVRSKAAGEVLAGRGYLTFNVADGFEGKPATGRRGWKAIGLPWTTHH